MTKINSAIFKKSVIGTDKILYDGKFQIVFTGRSNVGKSSLINSLTGNKNLAESSSHPGKTKRLNFFLINNKFYFVDIPGYGYAEVSAEKHDDIRKMVLWYLLYSKIKNRLVVLIIDAKVGPTSFDFEMFNILTDNNIDFLIVINKIDKLKMSEKERQLKNIHDKFPNSVVVTYSTITKGGKTELTKTIFNYLENITPDKIYGDNSLLKRQLVTS